MIRTGKKAVATYLAIGAITLAALAGMLPAPTQPPAAPTNVATTVTPVTPGAHLVP